MMANDLWSSHLLCHEERGSQSPHSGGVTLGSILQKIVEILRGQRIKQLIDQIFVLINGMKLFFINRPPYYCRNNKIRAYLNIHS